MADTYRIYYVGEGDRIEASPDGGRTWQEYTKCKVVEYGGNSYVWAPPGKNWAWAQLAVKHPFLFRNGDPEKPMLQKGRSIPVVVDDEGPEDSYLDLDHNELRAAFRSSDRVDLMTEKEYRAKLSPEVLRKRAAKLLAEAELKEGPVEKPVKKAPRSRKVKTVEL